MIKNPNTKQMLRIFRNNIRVLGLARTVFDVIGYLFSGPLRDRFDQRYGVATAGNVEKAKTGITDPVALADAIKYVPIQERVMRHVMAAALRRAEASQLTFIDFGSGKGRSLVMASWFPFRAVHGVELSPPLCELAKQNIATHLANPKHEPVRCKDVTVHCANALHWELPDSDLLLFLHRPFRGQVFQSFLERVHEFTARTGKRVLVAYACPSDERMLEDHAGYTKLEDCQVISEDYSWSLWECRPTAAAPSVRAVV